MKNTTSIKSMSDFAKNAIVPTDDLLKIKGGDDLIIIDIPLP